MRSPVHFICKWYLALIAHVFSITIESGSIINCGQVHQQGDQLSFCVGQYLENIRSFTCYNVHLYLDISLCQLS